MEVKHLIAFCMTLIIAHSAIAKQRIYGHVKIGQFTSDSPSCIAEDLALKPEQIVAFFNRAKEVSSETLIRDYLWAPCKREGTLRVGGEQCHWEVYASAIGTLSCPSGTTFHACEDGRCDDLLGSTFTDNRER